MKAPQLLLAALSTASAQTILWDGTANNMALTTPASWAGNVLPSGASQIGLIDNGTLTPPATINLNLYDFNGAIIRLNHAVTTLSITANNGVTGGAGSITANVVNLNASI